VSVMPRDVFEKLHLPELEPTAVCLGLGDNSIRYPLGITVDVPVKVGPLHPRRLRGARDGRGRSHKPSLGGLSSRKWEVPSTSARGRSSSTSTAREVLSSFDHALRYAIL
jgi:hypothetical protein